MTTNKGEDGGPAAMHATNCEQTSDGPRQRPPQRSSQGPPKHDEYGRPRRFEKPVAWLFGRQLLRSLRGILLYSAFGGKLDPRDWMTATPASLDPEDAGDLVPGLNRAELSARIEEEGGFWFDYLSDTGDGMRATYSIAYLCLSDLAVPSLEPGVLKAGDEARPVIRGREAGPAVLPRGAFLFVGGDTAYHASDYMTLIDRIYNTFRWAYEDLKDDGGLTGDEPPRPVYAIPGNHDYYDQLDGFRRQFHQPVRWEPRPPQAASQDKPPDLKGYETAQLRLYGFYRTQSASYVALRLPFGWQLWGLDTETGQINERQKSFFRQFCEPKRTDAEESRDDFIRPPKRLIVATCAPTTSFGRLADPEDFKAADAFGQLGIEQPFLPKDVSKSKRPDGTYDLTETGDARLKSGQCRLDISGDVHHYARYWGPPAPPCSEEPRAGRGGPQAEQPSAESYASVVSGIGGAFHHPSQTYFGQVREQSLYPSERKSTAVVAGLIFNLWNIWKGGYVQLAGALIAFLLCFAFTVPQSSREVLNNLPHFGLGLATHEVISPTTVATPAGTPAPASCCPPPAPPQIKTIWGAEWTPPAPHTPCKPGVRPYFFYFGECYVEAPADFWIGLGMALVAAFPLLLGLISQRLYQGRPAKEEWPGEKTVERAEPGGGPGTEARSSRMVDTPEGNKIKPAKRDLEHTGEPGAKLWLLYALAATLFFLGLVMVEPYRDYITPFASSLLVLLTFVWAGSCVALHLRYTEFLFKKAHDRAVEPSDWWLTYALVVSAVLAAAFGLWSFGQNNLPALLVSDILFIVAMLMLAVGLVYAFPFKVDAGLFPRMGGGGRSLFRALLGLWHFLLQLAVPFILVRKASWLTLTVAVLVVAVGRYAGEHLLARYNGPALAAVWSVLGLATVVLPIWLVPGDGGALTRLWFVPGQYREWWGLAPSVLAGVAGALMCCYWFGWYLGVCFAFNGHNNEVGGAARIEHFKQFIRFRLTDKGLTGYVIAVNDPSDTGRELTPHVVDVFHLRPKA